MSNDTTTTKQRPTHNAFTVRKYKVNGEHRSQYTKIGAAWQHGDGKGYDVVLECLPVDGRVSLRLNEPKSEPVNEA
jgi:hypothetical protein